MIDFGGGHQQLQLRLIGTDMKKGYLQDVPYQ